MPPPSPSNDPAFARERLAAVGSIASLVGHSARNRLAVVRAALELLQAGYESDLSDEQRTAFLRELDLFLADFNLGLEMIRFHAGGMEPVSLREAMSEAAESFRPAAERAGITLNVEYPSGPDGVLGHRLLLRQALLNLLRNAMEALVEAETPSPTITARAKLAGSRWHLEVEDNGPGVPGELHERLFRDFVSGRHGGAGLGLSLCRDAMTVMGGSIEYLTPRGEPHAEFRLDLEGVDVPSG